MKKDLTQGDPLKVVLTFMTPMLLGNLLQQVYNMADTAIVGRFVGKEALAAVGSTGPLNFLALGFVIGSSMGFAIPVANACGAKDTKNVRRFLVNTVFLSVAIAAVLTLITVAGARTILTVVRTPPEIFGYAQMYITVIFAGIPVAMAYNVLAGVSRALGDSRTPLLFLIMSSCVNIVLDILFITAFGMATFGAALATVMSQAVSALACFVYMLKKFPEMRIPKGEWRPDFRIMRHLMGNGMPMALQFSITAIGSIILQSNVNPYGADIVAAITAGSKVSLILVQPMEALGAAMAIYVSQNLGAGKIARVHKGVRRAILLALCFAVAAYAVAIFAGRYVSLLFVDPSETVILNNIVRFLLIVGAFYFPLGTLFVLRNSIQGLGYAIIAMGAGVFELLARALVGIFLVSRFNADHPFGFTSICFANPSAWLAANIILIPVYLRIKKRFIS
ncbi:MAG: MATE family efflux transporter [Clostridiales bacterium]|jgi:putative MATE family efflux protein|nr:MATE family efflux transporter [Clostridiales bacterium]